MLAGRPPASSASASFRAAMRAANSAYTGRPSGAGTCGSCATSAYSLHGCSNMPSAYMILSGASHATANPCN